jgi:transposase
MTILGGNMEKRNKFGRTYNCGKELSNDMRRLIIDSLIKGGADASTPVLPRGLRQSVGEKFGISVSCITSIWKRYAIRGTICREPRRGGRPRTVQQEDIDHVGVLKTLQPTMSLKTIKDNILQYSNVLRSISLSTVSDIINKDLNMTFKRATFCHGNRFTLQNLQYTERFMQYVNNRDPFSLKFMDEMGFDLSDGNKRYGHSKKGTPCVAIQKFHSKVHYTVSLIVGVSGVKYVKIVEGSSNSIEFLHFLGEAGNACTDDGERVLQRGDILIVDNAATHHNMSEVVLRNWLPTIGVQYMFLPTYSPDLNPAEQCFRKVKTLMKTKKYCRLLSQNIKVALYSAFNEINVHDTLNFFRATEYINV